MGEQGEAANHAAEIILCREANLPIQFYINAPAPQSIPLFLARLASDIIGKKAGRLVMGLGLRNSAVPVVMGRLWPRLMGRSWSGS